MTLGLDRYSIYSLSIPPTLPILRFLVLNLPTAAEASNDVPQPPAGDSLQLGLGLLPTANVELQADRDLDRLERCRVKPPLVVQLSRVEIVRDHPDRVVEVAAEPSNCQAVAAEMEVRPGAAQGHGTREARDRFPHLMYLGVIRDRTRDRVSLTHTIPVLPLVAERLAAVDERHVFLLLEFT